MCSDRLSIIGGEFAAPEREAAFQAERLPETRRHARLIFAAGAFLYALIIGSDWYYADRGGFWETFPLRLAIMATSMASFLAARSVATFPRLQGILLAWALVTTVAVAALCTLRPTIDPFVTLILPAIYLLVIPMSFRWTSLSALFCAVALLTVHVLRSMPAMPVALVASVAVVNTALVLLLVRGNRLRRMEWMAAEAGRRANDELAENRRLFETMFKAVPIPIVVSSAATGRIASMNDAALRFFGIDGSEALGTITTRDLTPIQARRRVQAEIEREGTVRDLEIPVHSAGGVESDVLISAEEVELGGELCVVSSLVDITNRKRAEQAVREAAHHDALTGLPNRALFQVTLDAALASAEAAGSHVGLVLIDLDAFKEVNDTLGHEAGDTLLKEVARRLAGTLRPGELVARLGGDEFVVISPCEVDAEQPSCRLHALAEEIHAVLSLGLPIAGRTVVPQASLGLALFPEHAGNAADLFTNADLALYAAKGAGRNRATMFTPVLRVRIEERVTVIREMRIALQEGGLLPHYQPKVDLQTNDIVGFEALARWCHPTRGLLAPFAFADAFDDPEIGAALGRCLMRQIFADVAGWVGAGLDPGRVFINLSSAQFAEADFAESLLADLASAGLDRDRIGVEVTETVLLGGHGDRVAPVLETLHRAGIRVALDDFGTGYASLTHLKQYPVDEIKIDRSFVRDLERDADDAAIVAAVLQLGLSLGLAVTAEGVETPAQARFLKGQGCACAQGYLYSKPMPPSRVPWFLANRPDLAFDTSLPTGELKIA
ncbi:putative bifunctional diguanylate cyclase/phosphodiesterase [Methylobacterium iners]|uniref:Diguanylate cyclase n=1 Tax=Methylobacterium iners TaxID=418707 RepID=A0ABQ4RY06_9HYPH|nr:bifunctional diguanylate cyclase/phosphodiesterase [Methylobacterium iners]GJD95119.1 hypothetical protein OCOJLMKI_2328 [Methylobacterium iners]